MAGWGSTQWGNFGWGETFVPQTVGTLQLIDNAATTFEPALSFAQSLTLALISNPATTFTPTTIVMGARGATSAGNLRRGIHHGTIHGGPFRASNRIHGQDRGSTIRGYRIRGNAPPAKTAQQATLGLISNAATVFTPQALGSLLMPFISNPATVFDLDEVDQPRSVVLGFISNPAVAFTPSIGIPLELIDNAAVVFQMSIDIPLGLIDNAAVAFEPQFNSTAGAARTVGTMNLISSAATALDLNEVIPAPDLQVNTPLIDNAAQAIQMFVRQEIPNVIRLKASFDDEIRLEATFDDVIRKKVKILGTKAPIAKLDDWNEDEDQTFIWDLPAGQNASGWTIQFRLSTENGAVHLLEYSGTVLSSTEVSIFAPAIDTIGMGGKQYWYEIARIDATHHQRIAHGPAWLGARVT